MFNELNKITGSIKLTELSKSQVIELQKALKINPDGILGPQTIQSWTKFKADNYQALPELIGPASIKLLQKKSDKNYDFSSVKGTIKAIIAEAKEAGILLNTQIAYILATVDHECSFKPVREAHYLYKDFERAEAWRKKNLHYYPFYGRGFVQLTWLNNYKYYSRLLGIDLVNNPDLAMNPDIAVFILVHGFKNGTFTGAKITDYINPAKTDFRNARRCINGTDRADKIAAMANKYLKLLNENKL